MTLGTVRNPQKMLCDFAFFRTVYNFGGIVTAPYGWEDLLMETGKFRYAIIAALASFFALSLAFAGEEDKAAATAEVVECAEDDVACAEAAAIAAAAKEEEAAMEEEEEEEEDAE